MGRFKERFRTITGGVVRLDSNLNQVGWDLKINGQDYSFQDAKLLLEDLKEICRIIKDDDGSFHWLDYQGSLHRRNGTAFESFMINLPDEYWFHGEYSKNLNEHKAYIQSQTQKINNSMKFQTVNKQQEADDLIAAITPYLNQYKEVFGSFAYVYDYSGITTSGQVNLQFNIDGILHSFNDLKLLLEDFKEAKDITKDDKGVIRWFDAQNQLHRKNEVAYYYNRGKQTDPAYYYWHGKRSNSITEHRKNMQQELQSNKSDKIKQQVKFQEKIWNLLQPYFNTYREYFYQTECSVVINNNEASCLQKVRGKEVSLKDLVLLYEDLLNSNPVKDADDIWRWRHWSTVTSKTPKYHRFNGPAVELPPNHKYFWLNGVDYDQQEFQDKRAKIPHSSIINHYLDELKAMTETSPPKISILDQISTKDIVLEQLRTLKENIKLMSGQDLTARNEVALELNKTVMKFNEIQYALAKEMEKTLQNESAKQENPPLFEIVESKEDREKQELWNWLIPHFERNKEYFEFLPVFSTKDITAQSDLSQNTYSFYTDVFGAGKQFYYIRGKAVNLEDLRNWQKDLIESRIKCYPKENYIIWLNDDQRLHRLYGPAEYLANGDKYYWFDGEYYPDITNNIEWAKKVKELTAKKEKIARNQLASSLQDKNKKAIIDNQSQDIQKITAQLKEANDRIESFNHRFEKVLAEIKQLKEQAEKTIKVNYRGDIDLDQMELLGIDASDTIKISGSDHQLNNDQNDAGLAIGQEGTALHIPDDEPELNKEITSSIVQQIIPSTEPIPSQFQQDLTAAGYRIAGVQVSKLVKEAILRVLPEDRLPSFTAFLETELGTGFVALVAGWIMTAAISDDKSRAQKLAEEFRIQGLTIFGNEALEIMMNGIVATIQEHLPKKEEEDNANDEYNGMEEELDQQDDLYSSANS